MYPRRCAGATGTIVFVRANVDQRRGVSVIGVVQDDQVARPRVCACKPQSEFIRLATRVYEETDIRS